MRLIKKQREPRTLLDTRNASTTRLDSTQSARAAFDQLDKQAMRDRLSEDQGALCAFCMRRIGPKKKDDRGEFTMKIAHRTPIKVDPGKALAWANLFGSCDGGQRSEGRYSTCDLAQGDASLEVDPMNARHINGLQFRRKDTAEGLFIATSDRAIELDLEATLRLNSGDLPALREQAWRAFLEAHRRQFPRGPYGKPAWREWLPRWLEGKGALLPEMLGVIEAKLRE